MGDQGSGEGDSGVQAVAVAECRYGGAGNEALHALTAGTPTELRVDLRTPQDAAFAHYRDFTVAGPEDHYRLHLGAYSGTAGIGGLGGVLGGLGVASAVLIYCRQLTELLQVFFLLCQQSHPYCLLTQELHTRILEQPGGRAEVCVFTSSI